VSRTAWCEGELIVGGPATGPLLALQEPLSFWGGVDDETGLIIDGHHPQCGTSLVGTALLMGATRGSSSSTSTLLECIRVGTAPNLLLLTDADPILSIAAVVAWELYGYGPSVVLLSERPDTARIETVRVDGAGWLFAEASEATGDCVEATGDHSEDPQ
jgi:predicted aconitase with swiveling domain